MPPPAVSSLARQTVSSAFKELERTMTPGDSRDFSSTTLQHVRFEVLRIEDELAARQALRNMRRLAPLFNGLEHYAKVMDVLCNGTPFLSWVWAPISLILRIASDHLEAFDLIIKGYSKIAESLGRFSKLSDTFKGNQDFQQTLAVFYADILEFHKHAYQFVRRSSWKLLFLTSWHRFQRRFDNIFESLQRHEELIDKEANAQNIAEAKRMRQEICAWREESNEQLRRAEGEQSAKQYASIVSWLRADDSDQLTISHALSEEGAKYPGTCDWILKNKKMTSLLQRKPDVPLLWIQGAAGTGKSILSSSIVTFMKSSDYLVLSHYCSHAYPSSTKYETILRSLLLQLGRQDGDLAAHVYENCVLGKKAPTIPTLEKLLQVLLSSICKEPRQTSFVWIVIDGIDECDITTQNNVFSLISRVTSKASGHEGTICKALISCRFSDAASSKLRKKQSISLADEKKHMHASIRRYASQRLESIYVKFHQLGLAENDVKEIEDAITNKSDGMFLYARLVLDYLSSNIFFGGQEIKKSVYELPKQLSEFYSKIMTQVLVRLDSRSVERVKCALGWIAFSKRPLRKIEFLSAVAFSSGDTNVKHVAPQYMLDICATLIEERPDSRLGFIHVSVKEFLQSSSSNLVLVERECLVQHGIATIACLTAGKEAFSRDPPPESVFIDVLRGLHGFHIYSKEYWTDYLFSLATPDGESDTALLFNMAHQLATNWALLEQDHLPSHEENASIGKTPVAIVDERISSLSDPVLQRFVNTCLTARSLDQLEVCVQQAETTGSKENIITRLPRPQDGVSVVLNRYQSTIRNLLDQADYPGVAATELESFKRNFQAAAYTCRLSNCPRATEGFERESQCHEHEMTHVRRLMCTFPGCPYPSFTSPRALKNHVDKCHSPPKPRKSIRRVGELPKVAANQQRPTNQGNAPFGQDFNPGKPKQTMNWDQMQRLYPILNDMPPHLHKAFMESRQKQNNDIIAGWSASRAAAMAQQYHFTQGSPMAQFTPGGTGQYPNHSMAANSLDPGLVQHDLEKIRGNGTPAQKKKDDIKASWRASRAIGMAQQDHFTQGSPMAQFTPGGTGQQPNPSMAANGLERERVQDYQLQLLLLEQQNMKRERDRMQQEAARGLQQGVEHQRDSLWPPLGYDEDGNVLSDEDKQMSFEKQTETLQAQQQNIDRRIGEYERDIRLLEEQGKILRSTLFGPPEGIMELGRKTRDDLLSTRTNNC